MAANQIVQPTPFMRSLTTEEYNAILSDVEKLIKTGTQAFVDLRSIISKDSHSSLKSAFGSYNDQKNGLFFLYDNLKNGYSSISGIEIDATTRTKIINLYNTKFKKLEDAGKGTPRYPTVVPQDGSTIILTDTAALNGARAYTGIYNAMANSDIYAAKAVSDYMFRHILNKEKFSSKTAEIFIESFGRQVSFFNVFGTLYRDSVAGGLACLRAIKEKLENYTPGSAELTRPPEEDRTRRRQRNST